MLEKLRRQFILIIMALVTAALAIMAGVIIYLNYQQLTSDVMSSLEYATTAFAFEDRGELRHMHDSGAQDPTRAESMAPNDAAQTDGSSSPEEPSLAEDSVQPSGRAGGNLDASAGDMTDQMADEPIDGAFGSSFDGSFQGGKQRQNRAVGADMVATSVYLVADGQVTMTLVDSLELDETVLQTSVTEVCVSYEQCQTPGECVSGHLDDQGLFYSIRQTPSGLKAAFASDAYLTNGIGNLAMVLGVVSLCVWAAFLLVSIMLARWVVRPTQRAWNQQQQFVADASHELKTPLAVMMANNSILLSHADESVESQRRWIESNQEEAHQMLDLVNDMLFLARPENAAERQQVQQDVDFSELVQGNVLQFEAVCFERGISLTDDIAKGLMVRGDATRLQRLARTLVDNACKYADTRVEVRLTRESGQAKLAITNDGATIPAEDLPHVFDRFYRVDKARVRSEGGVGLGLAIAQEVARQHGGSISVTSSESAGTTFTASLPLQLG